MLKKLNNKGISQILVFAVFMPFLFFFIITMAQITAIGFGYIVTNDAAYEGARAAAKDPLRMVSTARETVSDFGSSMLSEWNSRSTTRVLGTGYKPGDEITVKVRYEFPKYNYFKLIMGNRFDYIYGESTQIIEEIP